MRSHVPCVMVSSTYYDLKQVRSDMAHFIDDGLGYRSLLSEMDSFPISPELTTIENCKTRVREDADIFLLIVGGRYGFLEKDTGKSVTNLEYETARAKGIPVYVFVEKATLVAMSIWEQNPTADFSRQVDNPKLFEFIKRIRSEERVWVREFERSDEIAKCLRLQFAYLFTESLELYRRSGGSKIVRELSALSGKSLRIAVERPPVW